MKFHSILLPVLGFAFAPALAGCGDAALLGDENDDPTAEHSAALGDLECVVVQRDTFGSVEDTFVEAGTELYSYGAYPYVITDPQSDDEKTALVQFDLSFIPAEAEVLSATLTLTHSWKATGGVVNVHVMGEAWEEQTFCWNEFGGVDPTAVAWITTVAESVAPVSTDLTGVVAEWVYGSWPNHGVALVGVNDETYFRASEHSVVSLRPMLEVCYYDVE
jgi:hypothetical protein